MLDKSKLLVDSFNNNDLQWVVYKGKYHYMEGFCGVGDIDIYVDEEQLKLAHYILERTGFLLFETQSYLHRDGVEDWIGFDENTGKLIHVHLHAHIIFGNKYVEQYRFSLEDKCLLYAETDKNGICVQNLLLESILVICMFAKRSIDRNKLKKYLWGGVNTFNFTTQREEVVELLNEEDKLYLNCLSVDSLKQDSKLNDFANRFCMTDVHDWKLEYYKKLLMYKFSRLINL